jgi:predicted transcriptional regulator
MEKTTVKSVMSGKVIVAGLQHTFSQVLEFFDQYNMHHIPVMNDKKIIGMISSTDVMKVLSKELLNGETVQLEKLNQSVSIETLMSSAPVTIVEDESIESAMQLFYAKKIHALPVVDKKGELSGIITSNDVLQTYFKEMRPPSHFEINSPGYGI